MKTRTIAKKDRTPRAIRTVRTAKACKGKKGGCYWEGEPEGISKLRIAV